MTRILMLLALVLTVIVASAKEKKEQTSKGKWIKLFDGKNMDSWKGYNRDDIPTEVWSINEGSIYCCARKPGSKRHSNDIITKQQFENFDFRLKWKVQENGNSGIFYMIQEQAEKRIWQSAKEMQILDNERHIDSNRGKDGNRRAGALYDLIPARPQNAKEAGKWNKIRIVCIDGKVTHYQNGKAVVTYDMNSSEWKELVAGSKFKKYAEFVPFGKGHIGLQDHGDDVWFKKIRIRKL